MTDLIWVASSSVLILAILAVRAIFGKRMSAGFRYALWALVLIRLLVPGTIFRSPVSIGSAVMKTETAQELEAVKDFSSIRGSGEEAVAVPRDTRLRTVTSLRDVEPARVETYRKTIRARDAANVVWITGMALMAAYLAYVNVRFYVKLRERRKLISADAPCRVYSAEGLESSCLFLGSIYVSEDTVSDPDKLNCVLMHELAHRRHFDGLFTVLRCAALVLHWYNPLVWLAAYASRQDSELFADAGAVKALGEENRESYGRTLIALSAGRPAKASIFSTATAMTNGGRALKERVKHVASRRRTGVIVAAAVLLAALTAVGCTFLGAKNSKKQTDDPYRYSVTVLLDEEESLKFRDYGAADFPGIDCEEVENISAALEKTIKELVENGEYHPEDEKFNKCLRIKLRDPSEENAVKAAEKIRAMEHIASAEPFLEPYSVRIGGCLCRIEVSMLNAESRIEVADRVFLYPTSFRITAENEADGKTYELQEAYEKGLITYDGLSELYRIHVGYMIRKFGYTEESYLEEVRELYPTAAPETQAPVIGNYNEHDVEKLQAFLETEADGIRNGERLNAGYSFFDPRTWTYKRWDQTVELAKWDDDGYLVEITALVEGYGLTGDLDLSGCERLDKITFSSESIDTLDLTGCPLMKGVYIQNSALLKLLPDPLVTPRLSISNAGLQYIHWVAVPDEEMNKNMYDFDLTLIAKYGGSVGVWTSENLDCLDVTVDGYPAKGWHFENWYGPDGMKLENTEPFGFDWFHVPEGEEKPITGKYSFTAHFAEGEQRFAYRSGHAAYTEAVTRLMNGGGADDSLWRIHSCDVYFRLDEDAFRAYSTVEYYRVSTAGDYVFEYLDPIAEYPREVGEAALKRLYLELPAENGWDGWSLGTTAEGFAGEDWFMLKTVDDTMQDIQFACIYRKDGGEWHEFGTNKLPLNQPVFSAYVMNDKVGFVGYSGKNLDEPDGTYRKVYFYRTDDGGKTWQDMGLELPAEYGWPYPGSVLSPVFEGDHGAMTVDATRIDLSEYTPSEELELKLWYETFDGGRTWILRDEKKN